ncbi:MAG: Mur ligase family protein, partial [Desulfobacterales bacterium]|nr:Mur ligase family protein [Desulfobacterales bacterium]
MIDIHKNFIPDTTDTIHLIGACGTGMAALACMLKDLGYTVTGSDQKVYPPMSELLSRKNIKVYDEFDKKNISYKPDLVIIGNAVTKDNPEVIETQEKGLYFCSMPQAINSFIGKAKKPILITGTHGKTTTSSIIAWLLFEAGFDPTFFIGGILNNFNTNYHLGKGEYIVIEGDEYDTAFFDKGPKFMHYNPTLAVVTSIEFDHADIYEDIAHVKKAFGAFISGISEQSTLFAFDADPNISELTKGVRCHVATYGKNKKSAWRLVNISITPPFIFFDVHKNGALFASFKTPLAGEHNLLNTLAAIAIADHLKITKNIITNALEKYLGVKRRQEIRGIKRNITVIDDFAHHP